MVVVVVAVRYCTHQRMKKLALKRKEKKKNDKETYRSAIMVDIYGWLWLWYAITVILECKY